MCFPLIFVATPPAKDIKWASSDSGIFESYKAGFFRLMAIPGTTFCKGKSSDIM